MTIRSLAIAALLAVLLPAAAMAEEGELGLTVHNSVARKECGACHVPYSPEFLPARSWRKIIDNLSNHFGEDASVTAKKRKMILAYFEAHAADRSGTRVGRAFMRGIRRGQTPLRVTNTPMWNAIHEGVARHWWTDPRVKSKANCGACHGRAAQGFFGEQEE